MDYIRKNEMVCLLKRRLMNCVTGALSGSSDLDERMAERLAEYLIESRTVTIATMFDLEKTKNELDIELDNPL